MLSKTAEYALRATLCLARHAGGPLSTQQIAQCAGIPAMYLSKILRTLSRTGLVRSRRGLRGGFALTRPASRLTVRAILATFDPQGQIRHCPLQLSLCGDTHCLMDKRIDEAAALVKRNPGCKQD